MEHQLQACIPTYSLPITGVHIPRVGTHEHSFNYTVTTSIFKEMVVTYSTAQYQLYTRVCVHAYGVQFC